MYCVSLEEKRERGRKGKINCNYQSYKEKIQLNLTVSPPLILPRSLLLWEQDKISHNSEEYKIDGKKDRRVQESPLFYCFALNEKGREFINLSMGLPGIIITSKEDGGNGERGKFKLNRALFAAAISIHL